MISIISLLLIAFYTIVSPPIPIASPTPTSTPTTTPTPTLPVSTDDDDGANGGAIAGGVIAAIVAATVVVVVVVIVVLRCVGTTLYYIVHMYSYVSRLYCVPLYNPTQSNVSNYHCQKVLKCDYKQVQFIRVSPSILSVVNLSW